MTQNERSIFIKEFLDAHCFKLLGTKGVEYSRGEEDVNSNFKRLSEEIEITPKKVLFVYLKKHWDAITYWIKSGKTESEAIEGRIADAVNYLLILASLNEEERLSAALGDDSHANKTSDARPTRNETIANRDNCEYSNCVDSRAKQIGLLSSSEEDPF